MSRSTDTALPALSASIASSARGFPAPRATGRPPTLASTGPSTRISMSLARRPYCAPDAAINHAIYRASHRRFTAARERAPTPPTHHEEVHMSIHRHRRRIRRAALSLAACALVAPTAVALADPPGASVGIAPAPKIGDTPADFPESLAPTTTIGDTPVDFPGATRAPRYDAPRTISVVRPERTVVRDVDQALPIALSSAALLLALGGVGITLVRTGRRRGELADPTH
jgi:hypothetical protein